MGVNTPARSTPNQRKMQHHKSFVAFTRKILLHDKEKGHVLKSCRFETWVGETRDKVFEQVIVTGCVIYADVFFSPRLGEGRSRECVWNRKSFHHKQELASVFSLFFSFT